MRITALKALFGFLLLLPAGGHAQTGSASAPAPTIPKDPLIYFYNSRLDGLGQNVQNAAGAVANGQVFDTQLANLEVVSRLATDRLFSSGRRAALARIESSRNWRAICSRLETIKRRTLPSAIQQPEWQRQIDALKAQVAAAQSTAASATEQLKTIADLLEEVGNAQGAIEAGKFLQDRKFADITTTDLRVAAKLQEAIGNIGTLLNGIAAQAKPASARSAAEQMKVDLAKAEIDHLKALIQIEEKRSDGEHDVKDLLTAIENTLLCVRTASGGWECKLQFTDGSGNVTTEDLSAAEEIGATLERLRGQPFKLKAVVYLLENVAALEARGDMPVRIAELRAAIEDRRFAVRRDAIMARTYEQILLTGAQRIATYYRGGVKPETLAQFANALATAGLIPTIALK